MALEIYNNTKKLEDAEHSFLYAWDNPEEFDIEPKFYFPRTSHEDYRERGLKFIREYHENCKWVEREVIATEHRFCVDIGDHQLSGIVDILETVKGSKQLKVVDLKTGQRPNKTNLGFDIQFCADSETQILTRRGWKTYQDVVEGEDVLTYNAETDLAEWQPALSVNVFDAIDQELVSIEGLSHSSLTTKNHRWYVNHTISSRGSWRKEKRVVTSDALTSRDSIPCGRRVSNLPDTAKYDDDFVALVGWFWTEGHVRAGGSLSLAQKSGSDYEDIYKTLESLWGPPSECMRNGRQSLPFPAWRVVPADDANRFYLNRTASLELYVAFEDLQDKVLSSDFITSLTEDQLRLFIDVSIRADGHKGPTGVRTITQSLRSRLDAFAIACQLAGIRTSLSHRKLGGKGVYADSDIWTLVLKEGRSNFIPSKKKQSIVTYTGKVWCPTTSNGTWLARRNGTVYFTGNSAYTYAVQQKQFWCGYEPEKEKYKGFANGEELYEQYKDHEIVGVWYDLRNAKEYPVGARSQQDYDRMLFCLDQIAKAVELDVYVPDISGDTCGICSYSDICPIYSPPEAKVHDG
jgi:CRISPR/Cas system-associated exonuclease Cas4 (RecB family)